MWNSKQNNKYERCVKAIKQSMNEGKDITSVILENKILSLVEKHLNPKMTKGELMNLLGRKIVSESGTKEKEAPVKDPGTKTPSKPKTKDPFRPEPHKQPNPKANKRMPSWLTFNNLGIKFKK